MDLALLIYSIKNNSKNIRRKNLNKMLKGLKLLEIGKKNWKVI